MSQEGRVQSRQYQLYLLKVRSDERMARLRGLSDEEKPIEQIRAEFEAEHGRFKKLCERS